ncbi:type II toxin-antitoxin system prevent-host-death family antitoxin [Streptomyces sp. NPDC056291]|uniref:type II toxin-antitoxin system prevent-host-death family antitoxin n=1 Tax=Streptomyces sp. NPDC056291 TaxID=3345772 RepID=UPI0035E08006
MSEPKTERQKSIAEVRNELADTINRARYVDQPTVLTSRKKRVAVVVGMDFYERALAALGETRVLIEDDDKASTDD